MKIQGIDVIDANEEIEVTITPNDIKLGKKKSAHECAAARALCREHHAEAATVHLSRAYIKKNGKWWRYSVPPMLRSEVIAFDRGGNFAPGDYTLKAVQPTQKLDAPAYRKLPRNRNGSRPQTGNRPKKPYHVVAGVRGQMVPDWE
jgi:hypothetical protein